jgi:DNA-binding protein H-NS
VPNRNLASLFLDALLKLRNEVGKVLGRKAAELQDQFASLAAEVGGTTRAQRSPLKGRKAPVKYRDRSGNTWAGRGAQPRGCARS